jgi:glycerol-3-phosphate cytidylyltransferase-like family protein
MKNELISLINERTELLERIRLLDNVVLIAPYNFGKESLINYSIQKASVEKKIVSISLNMLFSISEDEFLCK